MIAREGLIFIIIGLFATAGFLYTSVKYDNKYLFSVCIIFAVLTLFTSFFFRDPQREIPSDPDLILSPADGKVIKIENLDNHEYVGGPTVKISIFLSVFDVHINRIPASGTVDYVKYIPGKFFMAFADKASDLNERTEIGMTAHNGEKIFFKQIAGLIARRIVYYLQEGDAVNAGDRFGLIRFGSRVEIFVPSHCQVNVKTGDRVKGGSSVIAKFKPQDNIEKDKNN